MKSKGTKIAVKRKLNRCSLKKLAFAGHGWLTPKVKSFEESPYIRLFIIAAVLAFPVQFLTERSDRAAEAEARAWERLTTPASGNSGRIEAIQYLVSQGVQLPELDLSCKTQGTLEEDGSCKSRVYLQGIDISVETTGELANLSFSDLSETDLRRSILTGADLNNVTFDGATLFEANLEDAFLVSSTFSSSYLMRTNFNHADLTAANFSNAKEIGSARFWRANLSGAVFPEWQNSRIPSGFYYVIGDPPTGIPLEVINHFVCGRSIWPDGSEKDLLEEGCEEVNPTVIYGN